MKTLMIVMLCAAALLMAGSAQAYAIYNHTGHHICIVKWYDTANCHVSVDPPQHPQRRARRGTEQRVGRIQIQGRHLRELRVQHTQERLCPYLR